MAKVVVTEQMSAPVEKVFQAFTDLEHGAERVSGIKEIDVMTAHSFSLGTRWREKREVLGRLDEAEMEVTAFEKNRSYTITHHKAGVRIDTVFTFEPSSCGTKVSIEFGLNPQGLPPGLLSPIEWAMKGEVREVLHHDLSDLKASVERLAKP